MRPLIDIERIRITLPPQWRGKERWFAQRVAEELGKLPVSQSVTLDRLQVPAITIGQGDSYAVVARRVAKKIHEQLGTTAGNQQAVGDSTQNANSVNFQNSSAPSENTSLKGQPDHA